MKTGTSVKKAKPFAGNSKAKKHFLRAILAKMDEDLSSSESESDSEQSDESDTDVLCEDEMKEDTISMMDSHILMMGDERNEDPFLSEFPHAAQEPKPEVVVTPPGDPGIDLDRAGPSHNIASLMESPQEPPSACIKDEPYLESSDWVAELEAELGQELQPPSEDEPATEKSSSKMSRVIQIARRALKNKTTATSRSNLQITVSSDGQRVVTIPSTSSPTIMDVTDVDMTDESLTTEGATAGTAPDRLIELTLTPPVSTTPAGTTNCATEWDYEPGEVLDSGDEEIRSQCDYYTTGRCCIARDVRQAPLQYDQTLGVRRAPCLRCSTTAGMSGTMRKYFMIPVLFIIAFSKIIRKRSVLPEQPTGSTKRVTIKSPAVLQLPA